MEMGQGWRGKAAGSPGPVGRNGALSLGLPRIPPSLSTEPLSPASAWLGGGLPRVSWEQITGAPFPKTNRLSRAPSCAACPVGGSWPPGPELSLLYVPRGLVSHCGPSTLLQRKEFREGQAVGLPGPLPEGALWTAHSYTAPCPPPPSAFPSTAQLTGTLQPARCWQVYPIPFLLEGPLCEGLLIPLGDMSQLSPLV